MVGRDGVVIGGGRIKTVNWRSSDGLLRDGRRRTICERCGYKKLMREQNEPKEQKDDDQLRDKMNIKKTKTKTKNEEEEEDDG